MAEAKQKKVTFLTSIVKGTANLRIVLKHGKPIYEAGVRVGVEKPVFANFKNGRFETDNEDYIEKLRGLSSYGKDFYESAGKEPVETTSPAEDLNKKTAKQLAIIAKERNLAVKEGMTKQDLLKLLK
jgi:hypothetical protein